METFSVLLAFCAGNSPVTGEFPSQRPVTRSFEVFCHLRLDKRLNKQSWGWWFEMLSRSLWRNCNERYDYSGSDRSIPLLWYMQRGSMDETVERYINVTVITFSYWPTLSSKYLGCVTSIQILLSGRNMQIQWIWWLKTRLIDSKIMLQVTMTGADLR